jgi:gas vesicle protein
MRTGEIQKRGETEMNENNFDNNQTRCATNGFGTRLMYLLIGGGLGAVTALLFAPKPGKELRGDIAGAAQQGYAEALETADRIKEEGERYLEAAREKGAEIYEAVIEEASEFKNEVVESAGRIAEKTKGTIRQAAERVN